MKNCTDWEAEARKAEEERYEELQRLRVQVVNLKGDLEAEKENSAKNGARLVVLRGMLRRVCLGAEGYCDLCGMTDPVHTESCALNDDTDWRGGPVNWGEEDA